ncbi:CAMK/CAMKL/CHK1 protein kinase [Fistulina hepatica ATCC 64428]|nr:CAMK/CAMKL/CHK1 protein kinase [Fistulina hepatica ATCC 64428]
MNPVYPKIFGYELVQQIGGGGFSTVFRAANFEEHRVAACKLISLTEETTAKERKIIDKEMRIHSALKHINVLEFINAISVETKYKDKYIPGIYILLELAAGGDLFDKIAPEVGVGEEVAQYYFQQLLAGMQYIHGEGVCHRDLKPENILLDAAGDLKISDFGLSAVYRLNDTGVTRQLTERCGSLPYVAPELNSKKPYSAEPIDVWGMGVILFTMVAGNTPWDEPTERSPEFVAYVNGEIFAEDPWNRLGESVLSLLRGLLTVDSSRRMTLADAAQHPWCMTPSQLANEGPISLADRITRSLRENGDMEVAAPVFAQQGDEDRDVTMQSATAHQSQFTQNLMLFSQTQNGARYTPHLTRFYAALMPSHLLPVVHNALLSLSVKCKVANNGDGSQNAPFRIRVGGYDRRREMFKGWVLIERFTYHGAIGSFCIMQRDEGSAISWRQLWKALIISEPVSPHVLRK